MLSAVGRRLKIGYLSTWLRDHPIGQVTAGLFEVAKILYGWYIVHAAVVNRFSTDASTGVAILFVVWIYYTALVFLVGAVVGETWDLRSRQKHASHLEPAS